jgi:hypothetical protein
MLVLKHPYLHYFTHRFCGRGLFLSFAELGLGVPGMSTAPTPSFRLVA